MERCPACRSRLADADICPRCGVDLAMARRAERQAQHLACLAVRQLAGQRTQEAAASAGAASGLANSPLARAVAEMIRRRESGGLLADRPDDDLDRGTSNEDEDVQAPYSWLPG